MSTPTSRIGRKIIAGSAAMWTISALCAVRRRTRLHGVSARAPSCPAFPIGARYAVWWTLDALRPTCLERALVLQQWAAAHGAPDTVIVGVPVEGVGKREIHAWLEGDPFVDAASYAVIHRLHRREVASA